MWKFPDPTDGFLQLVDCPIISHVPCMHKDIAVGYVSGEIIVVSVRYANDANSTLGWHLVMKTALFYIHDYGVLS